MKRPSSLGRSRRNCRMEARARFMREPSELDPLSVQKEAHKRWASCDARACRDRQRFDVGKAKWLPSGPGSQLCTAPPTAVPPVACPPAGPGTSAGEGLCVSIVTEQFVAELPLSQEADASASIPTLAPLAGRWWRTR